MKKCFVKFLIIISIISSDIVFASDLDDLAALNLADGTTSTKNSPKDWSIFVEAATGQTLVQGGSNFQGNQRVSTDLQYDAALNGNWQVFISDRLDVDWPSTLPGNNNTNTATALLQSSNAVNTFREGYLTWQLDPAQHIDIGRVNVFNGVAMGYNPTDYLKAGALRSIVSINPTSLKENRQGSVMFRGQQLWDDGAFSIIFSPKISTQSNENALSLDLGSTNNQNSMLVQLSQKIAEGFSPQILIYKSEQSSTQFGLNLSGVMNNSTTAYLEWSGGQSLSLLGQAITQQGIQYPENAKFNNQISTGLTYTTKDKVSLTAEIESNSAGLNNPEWSNLGILAPAIYEIYRKYLQVQQNSPTKTSLFLFAKWEDVVIHGLDISAMQRMDIVDSSSMYWLEARYRFSKSEVALQWQRNLGSQWSNYGAIPQAETIQLLFKSYL